MTTVEDRYAEALAAAIAADLKENPPPGSLVRVVIRWFDGPLYLTIHALGTEQEDDVEPDAAWAHFEAFGVEASVRQANPAETWDLLAERDLTPIPDEA